MNIRRNAFVGSIVAVGLLGYSAPVSACHEATICIEYHATSDDVTVGDYPDVQMVDPAEGFGVFAGTGVRVTVLPPPPEAAFDVLTDQSGCFSFETQWVWGHKLLVHNDAFLGDDANIRVTLYDDYAAVANASDGVADVPTAPWLVDVHRLGEDMTATVRIDADEPKERLFAWSVFTVARLEGELDPGLDETRVLRLFTQDPMEANAQGDCCAVATGGYGFASRMYIPPEKTSKKFMIAHEIGHWLQANWTDTVVAFDYYYHAQQDAACVFKAANSNSIHGLRSSERAPAAIAEGWGQFIASWTFDDPTAFDAQFKYYKAVGDETQSQYQDLIDDNYHVSLVGGSCNDEYPEYDDSCPASEHIIGGENAWVEYMCPNDWDYDDPEFGTFEVSSEIDWMRLFWQLTSDDVDSRLSSPASGAPAELWELLELWRLGAGNTSVWWVDLNAAVSDSSNTDIHHLNDRFSELTMVNGVNNGHGKY